MEQTPMARNRPGKRERLNAKRDAFQRERAAIMARNASEGKPDRPVKPSREAVSALIACGATRHSAPKGYRASIANRDNLRSHSHDIGFVGPRGFKSPRDLVSREEQRPGLLAPMRRDQSERERALALAALAKKD